MSEWDGFNNRYERNILNGHLRCARKLELPATLTIHQWCKTLEHFNGMCAYCRNIPYGVLEHVVPLSKGGGTTLDNCVPACASCNVRKAQGGLQVEIDQVKQELTALGRVAR